MTEKQWLAAKDWPKLQPHIKTGRVRGRKGRLFAVAGGRRIAHLSKDPRADEAVEVSEQFADGQVLRERAREAERAVLESIREEMDKSGATKMAWARDAAWRTVCLDTVWDGPTSCLLAVSHN